MDEEEMTPWIFVELMNQFYHLNWMMGSGGGMAAICTAENQVFYSPSSIQKERMKESDLFVLSATDGTLVKRPPNDKIKESACTPVFNLFINLTDAQCANTLNI
uniref:Class II aldolase/adducin N-terminal domain-containing protein n=1 Tax=Ditylenchus dipsaci TaxID=166011 RepID=A0A915EUT5_9BILA